MKRPSRPARHLSPLWRNTSTLLPSPENSLRWRSRQRLRRIDTRQLRKVTLWLVEHLLCYRSFDLGFYLVGAREMTRLNERFLHHQGSTDVITFDYRDPNEPGRLSGEIFLCIDEALLQAPRYRVAWQTELVRYSVHGLLHLSGYDDQSVSERRRMKIEEDRLLLELSRRFTLETIEKV